MRAGQVKLGMLSLIVAIWTLGSPPVLADLSSSTKYRLQSASLGIGFKAKSASFQLQGVLAQGQAVAGATSPSFRLNSGWVRTWPSEQHDEQFCVPIKTTNNTVVVLCL